MNLADWINGAFELAGGVMTWLNVARLRRDKEIKGVYWPLWIFFTAWGFWNLFYYPYLQQWVSFVGGIFLAFGNLVWVSLAFYYERKRKV